MLYRFSEAEWVEVVQALVELAYAPCLDVRALTVVLQLVGHMLRKKLPVGTLTLEWRPLWRMFMAYFGTDQNADVCAANESLKVLQAALVGASRVTRYMRRSDVAEVVTLLAPSLAAPHTTGAMTALALLQQLLPTWARAADLPPGTLSTWMQLWRAVDRCPWWDLSWATIFHRLAHPDRLEEGDGAGFLWADHLPFFFHRMLAALDVPVAGRRATRREASSTAAWILASRKPTLSSLFKLLVRLLPLPPPPPTTSAGRRRAVYGDGADDTAVGDASCVGHWERFFRVLRTHFYPTSSMAGYFASVLRAVTTQFVRRLARDVGATQAAALLAAMHVPAPPVLTTCGGGAPAAAPRSLAGAPLPPDVVRRFVAATLPLGVLGLYLPRASSGTWAVEVGRTLRNLAAVAPVRVCTELTGMATVALDPGSVNQIHTAPNALEVLCDTLPSLLYPVPHIMRHLPSLLHAALPGLDPNDDKKTLTAVRFMSSVLIHVPLVHADDYAAHLAARRRAGAVDEDAVDLPRWHPASRDYTLGPRAGATGVADDDGSSGSSGEGVEDIFRAARDAHAELADWSLLVVDRLLVLAENREKGSGTKARRGGAQSSSQRVSDNAVSYVIALTDLLLCQMSPTLLAAAAARMARWLEGVSTLDGVKLVIGMLRSLARTAPDAMVARLLAPHLAVAAGGAKVSPPLLAWHLSCLYGIAKGAGGAMLPHLPACAAAVRAGCDSDEKAPRKAAGKLLRALLGALLLPRPQLARSHNPDDAAAYSTLWLKLGVPYTFPTTASTTKVAALAPLAPPPAALPWQLPTPAMKAAATSLVNDFVVGTACRLEAAIVRLRGGVPVDDATFPLPAAASESGGGGGGGGGAAGGGAAGGGATGAGGSAFGAATKVADRLRGDIDILGAGLRGASMAFTDRVTPDGDDALTVTGSQGCVIVWDAAAAAAVLVAAEDGEEAAARRTSLRHMLLLLVGRLTTALVGNADAARDTKALTSCLKLTQRLTAGRGPRRNKVDKQVSGEISSEAYLLAEYTASVGRRTTRLVHHLAGVPRSDLMGFRPSSSRDSMARIVFLQAELRQATSLTVIPKALHYGTASGDAPAGDGDSSDDDDDADDAGAGSKGGDTPLSPALSTAAASQDAATAAAHAAAAADAAGPGRLLHLPVVLRDRVAEVMGVDGLTVAQPAELPALAALAVVGSLCRHPYDTLRRSATMYAGSIMAGFPRFCTLQPRTALPALEAMGGDAAVAGGRAAAGAPRAVWAPPSLAGRAEGSGGAGVPAALRLGDAAVPSPAAAAVAVRVPPSPALSAVAAAGLAARIGATIGVGVSASPAAGGSTPASTTGAAAAAAGSVPYNDFLGLLSLVGMGARAMQSLRTLRTYIRIVVRASPLIRLLQTDKQVGTTRALFGPVYVLASSWFSPVWMPSDPDTAKKVRARAALLEDLAKYVAPEAPAGRPPTALKPAAATASPAPAKLALFADGSRGASAAPLPPTGLHWMYEGCLGWVADMLLAPPQLPALPAVGDVAPDAVWVTPDNSTPASEVVWLWAASAAVSDVITLRDWGVNALALLMQGRLVRASRGRTDAPLPRLAALLCDARFMSQLVASLAAHHTLPGAEAPASGYSFPTPRSSPEYGRFAGPGAHVLVYDHIVLFELLLLCFPASFEPTLAAITTLAAAGAPASAAAAAAAAAAATSGGSGEAAAPAVTADLAMQRARDATVAEVFAGFGRVLAARAVTGALPPPTSPAHAAWRHNVASVAAEDGDAEAAASAAGASQDALARLLSVAAPVMARAPLTWLPDWHAALGLAVVMSPPSALAPLVRFVVAHVAEALAASPGIHPDAVAGSSGAAAEAVVGVDVAALTASVAAVTAAVGTPADLPLLVAPRDGAAAAAAAAAGGSAAASFAALTRWTDYLVALLEEYDAGATSDGTSGCTPGITLAAERGAYMEALALGGDAVLPAGTSPPLPAVAATGITPLVLTALFPLLVSRVGHPYKACRDSIANLLCTLLDVALVVAAPRSAQGWLPPAFDCLAQLARAGVAQAMRPPDDAATPPPPPPSDAAAAAGSGTPATPAPVPAGGDAATLPAGLWGERVVECLAQLAFFTMEGDAATNMPVVLTLLPLLAEAQSHRKAEVAGMARIVAAEVAQNVDFGYATAAVDDAAAAQPVSWQLGRRAAGDGGDGGNAVDVLLAELTAVCAAGGADTPSDASDTEAPSGSSGSRGGGGGGGGGGTRREAAGGGAKGMRWSTRNAALSLLVAVRARNVMLLTAPQGAAAVALAESQLLDRRAEVAEAASEALIGMAATAPAAAAVAMGNRFLALAAAKLPRVVKPPLSFATAPAAEVAAYKEYRHRVTRAVRKRYAGVLGASALVQAHPFDVPPHLPRLLLALAKHVSDPAPIATAVRELFATFKHTHNDNWEAHKAAFTSDELTELADLLVSANYYA